MKIKHKIVLALCLAGISMGCAKKVAPAEIERKDGKTIDEGRYSYVYVEAVKQKLLGNIGESIKLFEQALIFNPSSDASYYQIAQILAATGDNANSKKYLAKAIKIDQGNMWYLTMMAELYYEEKNLDSATYFYQKAVEFFPDKENLQMTLGGLYAENKQYDRAIGIYNAFDKKYGTNANSTVAAVRTMVAAQRYDEALEKVRRLLEDNPDEILYNGLLAEIYRGKGENEKAAKVYTDLLGRNPDNPELQLAVCDFLIDQKDYGELLLLLNNVVLNPEIRREDKITLFARLNETDDLVKAHTNELIITLMVFEANYRKDDIVPLLRPDLLIKTGRLKEAEDRLEEIVAENGDNYYAWEKLLLVYNQEKNYNELFVKGEECASRFNRSFLAKILYANAAIEIGKYEIADEELRKSEILAGNNKDFQIQVLTMRADLYYRMKEYDKAFDTFRQALTVNNEDLTVINNYAYYLAEQDRDLKEAEIMAKKVIEKEGNNATYLDTYAWVLYKRGKYREAARVMEQILAAGSFPDAEYYEHYGFILQKLHNCDKAVENWNYALKLDSSKQNLVREISNCGK